jgi:hypothetical protein
MVWTRQQIRSLVDIRKANNAHFHTLRNQMKGIFWQDVADQINLYYETSYTGHQAQQKFSDIVQACRVNKIFIQCSCFILNYFKLTLYDVC